MLGYVKVAPIQGAASLGPVGFVQVDIGHLDICLTRDTLYLHKWTLDMCQPDKLHRTNVRAILKTLPPVCWVVLSGLKATI